MNVYSYLIENNAGLPPVGLKSERLLPVEEPIRLRRISVAVRILTSVGCSWIRFSSSGSRHPCSTRPARTQHDARHPALARANQEVAKLPGSTNLLRQNPDGE